MIRSDLWIILALVLVLAATLLVGCNSPAAEATAEQGSYSGALDTSYENALDATDQLALGTLKLEGTADATTPEQAAALLPLWQMLNGGNLEGDDEQRAVLRQIESTMTGAQIEAIAAMRLTGDDMTAWLGEQGGAPAGDRSQEGGGAPGGSGAPGTGGRSGGQVPNISTEERATRMAQWAAQGGGARMGAAMAGGTSRVIMASVVRLLAERSGALAAARATITPRAPDATPTPEATQTLAVPTPTSVSGLGDAPTVEPTSTLQPSPTATPLVEPSPTPMPSAMATVQPAAVGGGQSGDGEQADARSALEPTLVPNAQSSLPPLAQIPDTNPGPPFSVEVSTNVTTQDPVVEASRQHKITGIVRNNGDQTYVVSGLLVTFYDADGFRGTFQPHIRDGKLVGGEWLWHGQTKADFAALLLAPGEEWPFEIEITTQDMASFLIHPDAAPTGRESVPVELSDVVQVADSTGYVRITGTATNGNPFKVKDVTVAGVLIDADGQIASVGADRVPQEDIAPGESVRFDVRVAKQAYVDYHLYAQAERDWD